MKHTLAQESPKFVNFKILAGQVGISLERSVTWKGLAVDPRFDQLADLTSGDVNLCLSYIANPERTRFERYAAAYSAYKLDPQTYVFFVHRLLELRNRGILTTGDIENIVTPPVNGVPNTIYDNYDRPEIQDLIASLLALPDLDDLTRNWFIFERNHGGFLNRMNDRLHALLRKLGL